jgi:hypothetical protein
MSSATAMYDRIIIDVHGFDESEGWLCDVIEAILLRARMDAIVRMCDESTRPSTRQSTSPSVVFMDINTRLTRHDVIVLLNNNGLIATA